MDQNFVQEQKARVIDARERLMATHIYFGGFAGRMQVKMSRKIPTAATNGVGVWFNPDFVATLSDRDLYGLSAHEYGHTALGHPLRRKGRLMDLWNIACDIVLNLILLDEKIDLPAGGIVQPQYANWSAEDVYVDLLQNGDRGLKADDLRDDPRIGPGQPGEGAGEEDDEQDGAGKSEGDDDEDGEDGTFDGKGPQPTEFEQQESDGSTPEVDDGSLDDPEIDDERDFLIDDGDHQQGKEASTMDPEAEWQIMADNLKAMADRAGQMKGDLKGAIAQAKRTSQHWASHLSALVENADSQDDYSWARPNRRYSDGALLFPGEHSEAVKEIVISIDTSGSMWSQDMMDRMAGEISGILKARSFEKAVLIYVDTEVRHVDVIDPRYEEIKFEPHGGGGTHFAPPFVWLQEHEEYDPACMIYLTDMAGWFGEEDQVPNFPVFWVNYGYYHDGDQVPEHWQGVSTVIHADQAEI